MTADRKTFIFPQYRMPDFQIEALANAPDATLRPAPSDGVAPENYHATTIYPEYYKIDGRWTLLEQSRMDCAVVISADGIPDAREFRNIRKGDRVVVGRCDNGNCGIYVHAACFCDTKNADREFTFRTVRSRETAYSRDYDQLAALLRHERAHGYVVWVLGPAVVFDYYARKSLSELIDKGYVDALLGGNAVATHDLEAAVFGTALGQDIYDQCSVENGHYHHLDVINKARRAGSLEHFVENENVEDGIVRACLRNDVPMVLAGSIRDDGPLPGVLADVYQAQEEMRKHTRKATTVVALATQLHTIATGNMTPVYQWRDGAVRPVYIYTVDMSEFVVNKLRDRGSLEVTSIVTNVQDFVVKLNHALEEPK
ncbi:MAG: hypothetical protein QM215_06010 [Bacillota bacterium]|jgi:lysine-ketoglutarate reductase/saccharopine dehydrogenase-like protein (TIGR00300 family)|nr:hypothetical protein [Eubacteriales bacterium]MDD3537225.1 hypothetical protein [Eubacteriales bacterium]MDD4285819.1 hypothetical protein [Eubacteriales bacterium]MDI9492466.1 hypothetical protein [Bacillota bacterium]HPF18817.1 hypothetical protein [Bacillota bacterium]